MTDSFDDKDLAIIGLIAMFIATMCVIGTAPKEMMTDLIRAFAPIWTAIVGAVGGIATGRKKEKE